MPPLYLPPPGVSLSLSLSLTGSLSPCPSSPVSLLPHLSPSSLSLSLDYSLCSSVPIVLFFCLSLSVSEPCYFSACLFLSLLSPLSVPPSLCLSLSLCPCLCLCIPVSLCIPFPVFSVSGGLQAAGWEQMAVRPWPEAHVITGSSLSGSFSATTWGVQTVLPPTGPCHHCAPEPGPALAQPASGNPVRGKVPTLLMQQPLHGPEAPAEGQKDAGVGAETSTQQAYPRHSLGTWGSSMDTDFHPLPLSYQDMEEKKPGWKKSPDVPCLVFPRPEGRDPQWPHAVDLRPAQPNLILQRVPDSGEKPGLPTPISHPVFWPFLSLPPWSRLQGNLGQTSALDGDEGADVTGSLISCVPWRRPAAEFRTAASGRNQHSHCLEEKPRPRKVM